MYRRLFLFLILFTSLMADDEEVKKNPLCTKYGGIMSIVNGSVSAISGAYFEDIPILSLQPYAELDFVQQYVSSDYEKRNFPHLWKAPFDTVGWSNNLVSLITCQKKKNYAQFDTVFGYLEDLGGYRVKLEGLVYAGILKYNHNADYNLGFLNLGTGALSGQTHPRNMKLYWTRDIKKPRTLVKGDGSKEIFNYQFHKPIKAEDKPKFGKAVYTLAEKTKPNGHKVFYEYDKQGFNVRVTNSTGETEFGSLRYSMDPNSSTKRLKTSDGREVEFKTVSHYTHGRVRNRKSFHIQKIDNPYGISATYTYQLDKEKRKYRLHQKTFPNGFFLQNKYYDEGTNKTWLDTVKVHRSNRIKGRVREQLSPVGPTLEPIVTHHYHYYGEEGVGSHTDVFDAYLKLTRYHYDRFQRLTSVEKYLDAGTVYRTDQNCFNVCGMLKGELTVDSGKWAHSGRYFVYDRYGNVIEDTLLGNLTGNSMKVPYTSWASSSYLKKLEILEKKYTYTKDGMNLVETEEMGRVKTEYSYLPKTNLLTRKLVRVDGEIAQREFNTYDINASIVLKIIDNGTTEDVDNLTGVTERKIERITPVASGHTVGLPEIVEELYFDGSSERPLKKTIYGYSPEGWVTSKAVYNAKDEHQYTINTEYNLKGQPLRWNDAEGNIYTNEYDEMGQVVYESNLNGSISYTYDHAGRVIAKQHSDNPAPETYSYDLCSNITSKVDPYGNKIEYQYDPLYRPVTEIHHETGAVIKREYDIDNNPIKITDANGNVTHISYTFYRKPYLIQYADGTKEEFTYNKEGDLLEKVSRDGLITRYEVDPFHRVTKVSNISAEGHLISEESTTYNAFHKISETNAEGITTHFKYDGAGRLIEVRRDDQPIKKYIYDANGRVAEMKE